MHKELREEIPSMPAAQPYNGLDQVFYYLAAVLLIISLAFGISYVTRSARIGDFTGVGQAVILDKSVDSRYVRGESRTKYIFDVLVTAGDASFTAQEKLFSDHGWQKGDIVPIVYNVKDPHEFVMGTTPEEYAKWSGFWTNVGIVSFLGAIALFLTGLRVKRHLKEKYGISG